MSFSRVPPLPSRQMAAKGLRFLLVFSPAWILLILIAGHATNIPVWDGWERAALLQKWSEGTLTFADLYAPHIDHRMVFPRIISLFVASVAQGDLRWEIGANWLIGLGAGLGVWTLARRTLGESLWTPGIVFLVNLWIFSPLQYDNWLWPIQTAYLLPMTCLVWALVAASHPRWSWGARCGMAAVLGIVGTHSFSHGLFLWPAILLLVALTPVNAPGGEGKWRFVALWVLISAIIVGCYFGIDYTVATEYSYSQQRGEATPMMAFWREAVSEWGRMWEFFLTILGGPFARQFAIDPLHASRAAGWLALFAYAACGLWALSLARRDPGRWARLLPWLALGGAVIAIAFGASAGRSAILASARATVPRFLSVSLYLPISFLAIYLIGWEKYRDIPRLTIWRPRVASWGIAIWGILVALQCQPWLYGARLMEIWRISRLQAQARVMFVEHFQPEPSRVLAYTHQEVQRYAPILNDLGFLDPPLVKTLELSQFSTTDKALPLSKGTLASAEPLPASPSTWELKGHAILRRPSRPADAVFITAESAARTSPLIIGLADCDGTLLPTRYRIDLQFSPMLELLEGDPGSWMRWSHRLDGALLPAERPLTVRAWAFDMTKRKAYPFAQRLILKADGSAELREEDTD